MWVKMKLLSLSNRLFWNSTAEEHRFAQHLFNGASLPPCRLCLFLPLNVPRCPVTSLAYLSAQLRLPTTEVIYVPHPPTIIPFLGVDLHPLYYWLAVCGRVATRTSGRAELVSCVKDVRGEYIMVILGQFLR
ncbi:hypothetical protein FRC08_012902 [Ceratobasidium sp. 394]|nr:hypothetical protein FRC08_012902 [Ceratobasidium sp. 394]